MRRLAIILAGFAALLALAAAPVQAEEPPEAATPGTVDVLQVSGLFDQIVVAKIQSSLNSAIAGGSQALILQVDSRGAVVDPAEMVELFEAIANSPITVGVWVGPTGARLYGMPAQILAVADVTGMAPGAEVGRMTRPLTLEAGPIDFGEATTALRTRSLGLSEARELNVFKQRIPDQGIATIANMVDALDGFEKGGLVLNTTIETVSADGTVQRDTLAVVRFAKLSLLDELFHTVASPPVTYLLLLIGLALILFEFFTAGIGIAGAVGAGSLILAAHGLAALPTRNWAIAIILLAMLAFAVDVQVGVPRFWTGIGIGLTIIGSWFLFDSLPDVSLRPSWITLITGVGGIMLTFIVGMPSMVRTRFATPTIGREWMIGATGVVVNRTDPDGVVEVNAAKWRARTNRATPLEPGDQVKVIAIDGVTLEIEPMEGAARDYREMRSKDKETTE